VFIRNLKNGSFQPTTSEYLSIFPFLSHLNLILAKAQSSQGKIPWNFHLVKSQDQSAEWVKLPIKGVGFGPDSMIFVDNYLILLAFSEISPFSDSFLEDMMDEMMMPREYSARLFAIDLRDLSVQQTAIKEWGLQVFGTTSFQSNYTLQKYNENQIIAFDKDCRPRIIAIKSFHRKITSFMTLFDKFFKLFPSNGNVWTLGKRYSNMAPCKFTKIASMHMT